MDGQENIRTLALTAFSALEDAELIEILEQIQDRVLARDCTTLFRISVGEYNRLHCTLNPVLELLLYHIADIAARQELSKSQRAEEIQWALDVSGF